MTIPQETILPVHSERIMAGGHDLDRYIRELVKKLTEDYQSLAQGVNGELRNDQDTGIRAYTPTISGSTAAGAGTYTHQNGWVFRQGLLVDVWFDIRWSAHTGTGNLLVDLPYLVAQNSQEPWVCAVAAQNITFTDYLTGNALSNTRTLEILDNRSGTTWANIAITNADTTLRGHVRYVGQQIERT